MLLTATKHGIMYRLSVPSEVLLTCYTALDNTSAHCSYYSIADQLIRHETTHQYTVPITALLTYLKALAHPLAPSSYFSVVDLPSGMGSIHWLLSPGGTASASASRWACFNSRRSFCSALCIMADWARDPSGF